MFLPMITLFLCGDVMTGRGIDQIFPVSCNPNLHESYMHSALGYVSLAESANRPIAKPVNYSYIWGDALLEFEKIKPHAKIINLETSITLSEDWEPKGINYRMHPENVACLTAAKIDCCALANNHILDWGVRGLQETLTTLHHAGLKTAGAGLNIQEAMSPAILEIPNIGRIIIFSLGTPTSGIPNEWAATSHLPGVYFLDTLSDQTLNNIHAAISKIKKSKDIIIMSIHWGPNWGYAPTAKERLFAQGLIEAGVDIVHGHSSHHPKGVEIYKNKLILYGCGDFINDYEGIAGYEPFRPDLAMMYFVTLDPNSGELVSTQIVPLQMKNFRLSYASREDIQWVYHIFNRTSHPLNTQVILNPDGSLSVKSLPVS